MTDDSKIRHSVAETASLIVGEDAIARHEAANALRQAQRVNALVLNALEPSNTFKLRPSMLIDLNNCAIEGLSAYAGNWRPQGVKINDSDHQPPPGGAVAASLAEDMCDYVNENWNIRSSIHLASFVMWRLNWIHPFVDGNGRTSRAASYVVLCAHVGALLPGQETIPAQVVSNRIHYYDALEAADKRHSAAANTFPFDIVSEMEELLSAMLANQLKSAFDDAVQVSDESSEMISMLGAKSRANTALIDSAEAYVRESIAEIKSRHPSSDEEK